MQRPEAGAQEKFVAGKEPQSYRYDPNLSPELDWDENPTRAFVEWLITLVIQSATEGKERVFAEPQVWKGTGEQFTSLDQCAAKLKDLTKPFLNWAGKAERRNVSVPTLPLFMHERLSTQAVLETLKSHRASGSMTDLFGDSNLSETERLDAYEHKGPWINRLILGDSLQVMNSLLEYESMAGQIRMIYFDPPYGVRFGSNFQPFVSNTEVTHNSDENMVREPEMVKAYRDTWELGIHSYLTYMRDRLLLAKDLLADNGSIFVQISDVNVHHIRELMDEIFPEGFVSQITYQTTASSTSGGLSTLGDFLLWYVKDKENYLYNKVWKKMPIELGKGNARMILLPDGTSRSLTLEERKGQVPLPKGAKLFAPSNLQSQHPPSSPQPFEFEGKVFQPVPNRMWTARYPEGMENLKKENRLYASEKNLYYIRFANDFPFQQIGNIWNDVIGMYSSGKIYVVQTPVKVIENCIQMSTEPGDLVLDLTCGSGTTPFAAEKWGRRWMAIDTSRVPLALARQRLLSANYPWFKLKNEAEGPAGGFVYKRKQNNKGEEVGGLVPRVTVKSIASKEEPAMEKIVDRAEVDKKITRICGAFSVEATVQPAKQIVEEEELIGSYNDVDTSSSYLSHMVRQLQQCKTIRMPGNKSIEIENAEELDGGDYLHARASLLGEKNKSLIAIAFGPKDGTIDFNHVHNAADEAIKKDYHQLFLFGFDIQPEARARLNNLNIPTSYVQVAPDVVMHDLLKTSKTSEIFTITGLPDIVFREEGKDSNGEKLYRVSIKAVDICFPDSMKLEVVDGGDLPCWMLDSDYNGMVFHASQVFFPKTKAWNNLRKSLGDQYESSLWNRLAGTDSEPFALGPHKRIAVKVIDMRGAEMMAIKDLKDLMIEDNR